MKMSNTKQVVIVAAVLLGTRGFNALADQAAPAGGSEKSYTGQVISVDQPNRVISVKSWIFSKRQFSLGDNCACVMLGNQNNTADDLRPGEKVTVHYQVSHGVRIADRIEQQPMLFEGTVAVIDLQKHEMILHRTGLDKPMQIAAGCNVVLKNDRSGVLTDIKPGDHVTVTYEIPDEVPTARQISQTSAEFTGKLTAIDLGRQTVKAEDLFSTKKFNLADNCEIMVNGQMNGKLSDLKPDERLVFNYNSVNGVNVVNRIAPAPENGQTNSMFTVTPDYSGYPGGY